MTVPGLVYLLNYRSCSPGRDYVMIEQSLFCTGPDAPAQNIPVVLALHLSNAVAWAGIRGYDTNGIE